MRAIILAGGEGKRLRPITTTMPKPLIPVMGKPLIGHIIELLRRYGITQIGIAAGYRADRIEEALSDGAELGVTLTYFHEEEPLGTAGCVKNAGDFLSDPFLVIAGDCLTDASLSDALGFHQEKQAIATLLLKRVDVPLEYGVAETDAAGKILRFTEKPTWQEALSNTANTGIYLLNREILDRIPKDAPSDFAQDIFPKLLEEGLPLYGYTVQNYWCDVGDTDTYRRCQFDVFDRRVSLGGTVSPITVEEGAIVEEGATLIPPVYVGRGSRIEAGAHVGSYCVIGRGCLIRRNASVSRSLLMDRVLVEPNASVRGAILCDSTVIKRGASVFEQAVIGQGSVVDKHTIICPGVRVYPYKKTAPSREIAHHVMDGAARETFSLTDGTLLGAWGYEIAPQTAELIGTLLGGRGKSLAVSYAGDAASESLLEAFCAGARGSGAAVYELGIGTAPMTATAVRTKHLTGGVWFGVTDETAEVVLYGKNGVLLTQKEIKEAQKKLRGGEAPVSCEQVGARMDGSAFRREYIESLLACCEVRNASIPVSLFGRWRSVVSCAQTALSRMGCVVYEGAPDKKEPLQSGFGAYLIGGGRELTLYTPDGMPIFGEKLKALLYHILSKDPKQTALWATEQTPKAVCAMLEKRGIKLIKTSKDAMETTLFSIAEPSAIRQRMCFFDATGALMRVAEHLIRHNTSLDALLTEIPPFFVLHREAACEETQKAEVLSKLKRSFSPTGTLGCMTAENKKGIAYIYPDNQQEKLHIMVESTKAEYAEELADFYENAVRDLYVNPS